VTSLNDFGAALFAPEMFSKVAHTSVVLVALESKAFMLDIVERKHTLFANLATGDLRGGPFADSLDYSL
jgi:hypothetical protein